MIQYGFSLIHFVPMYIEKVPNRSSPPTYLLRIGRREGKKVHKTTIANVSHWPPHKIETVRRALKNETLVSPEEAFSIESSTPHGHVEAVLAMMRKLKIPQLIERASSPQRDIVTAMIAQRIIAADSKLASVRLLTQTTLADELGCRDVDEDDLYQAMDWLGERQADIERRLAKRHLRDNALVYYDVSSSYYEGVTCPLMRFGYSRDGKRGRPIVVYGVLADRHGRPISLQAYPGNTADPSTLGDQLDRLRLQFGLRSIVLVGDRGMLTQTGIDTLRSYPGIGWISALTHDGIRKLAVAGTFQPTLFDRHALAEIGSDEHYPGERLIVCFNPLLQDRRAAVREELLKATEKAFGRIRREVDRRTRKPLTANEIARKAGRVDNRHRMAKHFDCDIGHGRFGFVRNEDSIAAESALDGFYIVRTVQGAQTMTAAETVRNYKNLAKVETAFRCLKAVDLQIRPIRHRTEPRVRAHLFICMLAYYVQWHLKEALRPLLYREEYPDVRDNPVAPPEPSDSLKRKKSGHRTEDGLPLHSFPTLISELGLRCRNQCRFTRHPDSPTVTLTTDPTPVQQRVLELVRMFPVD